MSHAASLSRLSRMMEHARLQISPAIIPRKLVPRCPNSPFPLNYPRKRAAPLARARGIPDRQSQIVPGIPVCLRNEGRSGRWKRCTSTYVSPRMRGDSLRKSRSAFSSEDACVGERMIRASRSFSATSFFRHARARFREINRSEIARARSVALIAAIKERARVRGRGGR